MAALLGTAALAVALSGCGIRSTALPVDAGEPASRTACPPPADQSPLLLPEEESTVFATPGQNAKVVVVPPGTWPPSPGSSWEQEVKAKLKAEQAAGGTPAPSASPSAAADTASCLPSQSPGPGPTDEPTGSPQTSVVPAPVLPSPMPSSTP